MSTRTATEVKSPTSTSTKAHTQGNVTVTGGAGRGATTSVTITSPDEPKEYAMSDKSVAEEALAKIPPPGSKPGKQVDGEDDEDNGYDAASDSMKALMDALKGDDVNAALDAWGVAMKNC